MDAIIVVPPESECNAPSDCPGVDVVCQVPTCVQERCGLATAEERTLCSEGGGIMCDAQGVCVECLLTADCTEGDDQVCLAGSCVDATCADGAKSGSESDIDCGGECPSCLNGDVCFDGGDCESLFCQPSGAGGAEPDRCAACTGDLDCDPYACDGDGDDTCLDSCVDDEHCGGTNYCSEPDCVPKNDVGTSCAADNQCLSGFCADDVCCASACTGSCEACDTSTLGTCTAFQAGASGSPSCGPYLCDGAIGNCPITCAGDGDCTSSNYCEGPSCDPKKPQGASCGGNNECADSRPCVDGRCCNSLCSLPCNACDVPANLGTCVAKPDGQQGTPSCDPYLCNGSIATCPTVCVTVADCVADHYCGGSPTKTCQPLKIQGAGCGGANECQSGFCVDGFCCDTLCGASCDRCDLGGGVCTLLADGQQGTPSCSPYLCDGSASCPTSCVTVADCDNPGSDYCDSNNECVPKKGNGSTCASADQCQSNFCVDGYCCNFACGSSCDVCNRAGLEGFCAPALPGSPGDPSCSPYVCDGGGASCPGTCANDSNCAVGFVCNAPNCE